MLMWQIISLEIEKNVISMVSLGMKALTVF